MATKHKLLIAISLLTLGVLLTACGQSSEKSQDSQSTAEPTPPSPTNQPGDFAPPGTESELKPVECPQVDLVALVWEQLENQTKEISSEEQLRERLDAIVEQLRERDKARDGDPAVRCEVIAREAFENKKGEGFKKSLIDYLVEELRKAGKLGFLNKT